MRGRWGWTTALLAAAMIAALPARAQQQDSSGPDRILEEIGGAIRGLFRGIFGAAEGELQEPARDAGDPTSPRDTQIQSPPPARPQQAPVAATPSAQAMPQSLHAAIAKGDYSSAVKMIEQGADIEAKDPGAGASALHYAVMKGEIPMVGLLVQRGADVNSRTKSGTTPLHTAVLYNRFDVAEYLIGKGSEVNARSTGGATPLSLALAARHQRIEKLLRGNGAN